MNTQWASPATLSTVLPIICAVLCAIGAFSAIWFASTMFDRHRRLLGIVGLVCIPMLLVGFYLGLNQASVYLAANKQTALAALDDIYGAHVINDDAVTGVGALQTIPNVMVKLPDGRVQTCTIDTASTPEQLTAVCNGKEPVRRSTNPARDV